MRCGGPGRPICRKSSRCSATASPASLRAVASELGSADPWLWVATGRSGAADHARLVAVARLRLIDMAGGPPADYYLAGVIVDPRHRGHGIGACWSAHGSTSPGRQERLRCTTSPTPATPPPSRCTQSSAFMRSSSRSNIPASNSRAGRRPVRAGSPGGLTRPGVLAAVTALFYEHHRADVRCATSALTASAEGRRLT
jgi:GNAT superfamily N-acetyltransferase